MKKIGENVVGAAGASKPPSSWERGEKSLLAGWGQNEKKKILLGRAQA